MTKEISKANILQEIQDKFGLREFEAEKFLFGEYVIPTYDIGAHVKQWVSERDRLSVTANGTWHFHIVPSDETWRVRRIVVLSETGGNFDIDQIFLYRDANNLQYLFYNTAAPIANGTVNIFAPPQDISMSHACLHSVTLNVSNFVTAGYVSVHILKEVETFI